MFVSMTSVHDRRAVAVQDGATDRALLWSGKLQLLYVTSWYMLLFLAGAWTIFVTMLRAMERGSEKTDLLS
jgi:hypothetical protein